MHSPKISTEDFPETFGFERDEDVIIPEQEDIQDT